MTEPSPARVLLVDDRPANLTALEAILGDLGLDLVRATSGQEALKRLLETDFAAVLLDVQMPELGGFEVARLIRARPRSRATPVIFLTADQHAAFPVEAYRLGAVDYLVKPLVPEAIRAKVAVFVELHRLRAADRKQAEDRLRVSEARLRAIVEATPECIKLVAADGTLLQMNRAGLAMVEADESALGQCVYSVVAPEDRGRFVAFNERVCRGERGALEFDIVGLKGTRRHMETTAVPLPDPAGGFTQLAVTRDVTARKAAEAALRESEGRFRQLAETIPNLAWVARPDGTIFWYNRRWYEYTGTTPAEMEGWGWQGVHDPAALPGVLARWRRSLDTGEPFSMVFPLRGADGAFRPFLTLVSPLRGDGGAVQLWFGTNTDISEQKRGEEELARLNESLREAARRKDEFLATLAHELRNPLAPLWTAVAVLRRGPPAGQVGGLLDMMGRQLGHLVHLVDDLLDVARVTTGKVTLRTEPLDLRGVLDVAVETSRPAVEAHRHELAVALPEGPLPVVGDPTRLAQVLTNLLTNAAKYTPASGRIELTASRAGAEAVVRVTDTGVGIPAVMLPKVFDLFTQVDREFDRTQGGLGIGLALVKKLVELHGGAVTAESPGPGLGSTFTVRLPVAPDEAGPAAGGE